MIDMEEIYPALALWYQIPDEEIDSSADNLVVVKPTGCHMKGHMRCPVSFCHAGKIFLKLNLIFRNQMTEDRRVRLTPTVSE